MAVLEESEAELVRDLCEEHGKTDQSALEQSTRQFIVAELSKQSVCESAEAALLAVMFVCEQEPSAPGVRVRVDVWLRDHVGRGEQDSVCVATLEQINGIMTTLQTSPGVVEVQLQGQDPPSSVRIASSAKDTAVLTLESVSVPFVVAIVQGNGTAEENGCKYVSQDDLDALRSGMFVFHPVPSFCCCCLFVVCCLFAIVLRVLCKCIVATKAQKFTSLPSHLRTYVHTRVGAPLYTPGTTMQLPKVVCADPQ